MKKGLLLIIVSLSFTILNAQTTVWDYPLKPGTAEWLSLSDHEDMIKACQVPEGVLKSVSTTELIAICLNYPLSFDFYAYNNLQEGVKKVTTHFNGLQELFKRKDNAQYLLEYLNDLKLNTTSKYVVAPLERGKWIIRQSLIETFLSKESVLANASSELQKEIASIAIKNMLLKEQQPNEYSRFYLETSAYLLCAALNLIDGKIIKSPILVQFLETGSLRANEIIEELGFNYSLILTKK